MSRLSRLLQLAHLLPVSAGGNPFVAMSGRGVPARARRIAPAAAPKPTHSIAPVLATSEHSPREDDPDDEMRCESAMAQARRRERARCAAIVTSAAGLKLPDLAYALAFRTRLSRSEALSVLDLVEAPSKSRWAHLQPALLQLTAARQPRARPRTVH
jgi:hypothetical protein